MFRPTLSLRVAGPILLAALAALSPIRPAAAEERLGSDAVPTFEAVRLRLDPGQPDYSGSVRVDLEVRRETAAFRFHAEGQRIERLALLRGEEEVPVRLERGEHGLALLTAERPLAPGPYRLEIDFSQAFNTRAVALYKVMAGGRAYAFSQLEADEAREAFPCWDEPSFKIPYELTLEVPAAHQAVSNMPVARESVDAGWKTVAFERTPPLPSYLLALATGPLEFAPIQGLSVPGRVVTVAGQDKTLTTLAAQVTPPLLAALERWFGRPYPFPKLDLIAVPEFWPGAMENPGAVTYADSVLLLDPARASLQQRMDLARITAHELAHMWFGDLVTLAWWDDLWLNEAFADWLADKVTDEVFPEYQAPLSEVRRIQATMESDALPSSAAIRQPVVPENLLTNVGLAYGKGKAVLNMFESWLGPETFRQGIRDYVRAREWGNATSADLLAALSRASGRDVGAEMKGFLEQPGLPLVRAEARPGGRVRLSQRRFLADGAEAAPLSWQIPVALKVGGGATVRAVDALLAGESAEVAVENMGEIAWVLPDRGGRGYYRWSVPETMLLELARRGPAAMDPRERVSFLGNLAALLEAGEIHGDAYLAALAAFAGDPEPQVLSALISGLDRVEMAFVPAGLDDPFAAYVRATLGPALARFGRERRPGEAPAVTLFRPQLLLWLGQEGRDGETLRFAAEAARRYMADPAAVDPSLVDTVLRLAALSGDRALFEEYRRRFESAPSPAERRRFLGALGWFADRELQEAALRYSLEGPLRANEFFMIAGGIGSSEEGADRIFLWVIESYDRILATAPPVILPWLPQAAQGCSLERLARAREFFSRPGRSVPGTADQLARVADQVTGCARLREREGAAVATYLRKVAAEGGASAAPSGGGS